MSANDLFNYFDKLGEHDFLEEARTIGMMVLMK